MRSFSHPERSRDNAAKAAADSVRAVRSIERARGQRSRQTGSSQALKPIETIADSMAEGSGQALAKIRLLTRSPRSFFLHQLSDGAFELKITPFGGALRIIHHLNIRIDLSLFHEMSLFIRSEE